MTQLPPFNSEHRRSFATDNLLLSFTLPVLPISSIGCSRVHVRATSGVADVAALTQFWKFSGTRSYLPIVLGRFQNNRSSINLILYLIVIIGKQAKGISVICDMSKLHESAVANHARAKPQKWLACAQEACWSMVHWPSASKRASCGRGF